MDRKKNDSNLCKIKEITTSKMNDLNLMKVKGGHSWPPILCEEICDVLCGHLSIGYGLSMWRHLKIVSP
jgi:hypothetical protein